MVFRQCSIGGKAYWGDSTPPGDGEEDENENAEPPLPSEQALSSANNDFQTVIPSSQTSDIVMVPSSNSTTGTEDIRPQFKDITLLQDLENALSNNPDPQIATHSRLLNGFFTVLALCHTVLTSINSETGELEYKAQSPDEAALVQAAADVGFVFCGRDKEILSLRTPSTTPDVEKYELLNILEFTSARKRMSVVLRKLGEDGRLFMLTKGADNVIFERLRSSEEELRAQTEVQLSQFANEGLRTLTLAYKVIGGECIWWDVVALLIIPFRTLEDEYLAWNERYHAATISVDDRETKIEHVCNELEQNLRLLGATAIEDRLQDGVPDTIADLKRAGIKIWVATGDKMETAIGTIPMDVVPQSVDHLVTF
jgi:phospholipid-translocating ATPase